MLDLNVADDAKEYIRREVERGGIRFGHPDSIFNFETGSDEDYIRVAKQLFLYCDTRIALGDNH